MIGTIDDWVSLPDVPVIVSEYVPTGAVLLAVNVIVEFVVIGLGTIDAVTPAGKPETARLTSPVNPFAG